MIEPGLYPDMDDATYFGDRDSLSVSGMKKLVPPSCPARFKWDLDHPEDQQRTDALDFGSVAHALVLGKGIDHVAVAPFADWRTKPAREFRDDARADGKAVILLADYERAKALAESVKSHRLAMALLTGGAAEVSAFWDDVDTGVRCRARFDYLPEPVKGRRLVVSDLKTALSANPHEFGRASARFFYEMQDAHYSDAARELGIDADPVFLFLVVEKEPPYLVTVGQLSEDDKRLGRALNDKARRIYRQCVADDHWPGYVPDDVIANITLPPWHHNDYEEFAFA